MNNAISNLVHRVAVLGHDFEDKVVRVPKKRSSGKEESPVFRFACKLIFND